MYVTALISSTASNGMSRLLHEFVTFMFILFIRIDFMDINRLDMFLKTRGMGILFGDSRGLSLESVLSLESN